ncbi:MAG: S-methyl-5-thioribose-1-phosphate isomerase [Candidatus Bathyarchaeota archaeon]|nr:S-methyl-5-thioribose-1-phosphate isomerase [Candidatus Bathyarchaeota archaeon]
MAELVHGTAEKIRRLEVQGARNVAIAAVKALEILAKETKAKKRAEFMKELSVAKELLFASRETEPLMRNAVRWILNQVEDSDERNVSELARVVSLSSQKIQKIFENAKERIAEIGAKRIYSGATILTHCHSSTVTYMLNKALKDGKKFRVICTETRPAFQGRLTAKEMLSLGIKTTFIVDSAARSFMHEVDLVMVGADALTSEGSVINKIGTGTIALLAQETRKPFYVVSELLKFDPTTLYGEYEKIEERGRDEVWKDAPTELDIRNPAFDVTPPHLIHGIICEEGIISPNAVTEVVYRVYPWVLH